MVKIPELNVAQIEQHLKTAGTANKASEIIADAAIVAPVKLPAKAAPNVHGRFTAQEAAKKAAAAITEGRSV